MGLSGIAGDDSNVLPILRAVSRRITRKSLTVSAEYFASKSFNFFFGLLGQLANFILATWVSLHCNIHEYKIM